MEPGTPRHGFAKDAMQVEDYVRSFERRRPNVTVTVLRTANQVGPTVENPLTRYFALPVCPVVFGFDPRLQFLHEEDASAALLRVLLGPVAHGTYNLAGDGVVLLSQAIRMTLSPRVPALVERGVGALVHGLLAGHGLAVDEVAHWVVHPGGPEILERVQRRLGLADAQLARSWEVLADGGNRSSATILFILDALVASGDLEPGQWVVMLAFGTGLTMEALLLRA
jgi:hypothetical protein